MIKAQIINLFLSELDKILKEHEYSYDQAEKVRKESPGPMESHSDTTRSQKEAEVQYFLTKIKETKEEIINLKNIGQSPSNLVDIGSLVELENVKTKQIKSYLISKKIGGLRLDDISVTMISSQTDLARSLLDKSKGDELVLARGDESLKLKILKIL